MSHDCVSAQLATASLSSDTRLISALIGPLPLADPLARPSGSAFPPCHCSLGLPCAGKFAAAGASACSDCPSGSSSPAGSDSAADCVCNAGLMERRNSSMLVCSDTRSAAPFCEVTFSGIPPGASVALTIEVANTDFSGSDEYISSVLAGSLSMGSGFLAAGGQDNNCGKMDRILDDVQVPAGAFSNARRTHEAAPQVRRLTVRIETTSAVGCCSCNGGTLYAVVSLEHRECVECQPGQYLSSGSCRSCAPGSYKGSAGR